MTQIWEIIPKITSPLAVVCFGIYVFYLIKRSEDRKKEKTLSVGDSEAQKEAVSKILDDYPNIEIDPIRNPDAAAQLANRIIADKLARYNKLLNTILIFALIFAATFLLSAYMSGRSTRPDPVTIKCDSLVNAARTWAQLEAIKKAYPYATLSIVQHIKLKDLTMPGNSKKRVAEFRNYYTISATKDITSSDPVFEEQFLTNNATIEPWPGSEAQEVESISDGRYWVKFDLPKNGVKTIVTGANYFYSTPLTQTTGTSCFGNIVSSNTEWMTCYPNSVDYIDNLTIVIEAEGIDISLPPNSTYRKEVKGNVVQGDGKCKVFSTNNHCTLSARWENISPGECVGFKISWSLPR